jgi:small-conductance mechanosensitive channel
MSIDKKKVVVKTFGTSWISSFFIAIVVGLIGLLIVGTNPSWNIPLWEGFLSGFIMTFVVQLITLACCIPFVGIYLYWVWANSFCDWFFGITHLQALDVMRWIPLLVCGLFGIIFFVLFSLIALVFIGAIVSAILSR